MLLSALALAGCAHAPPPPPPAPPPPPRIKLAVLPVESDAFPGVADAINAQLREVQVKGVDDYFFSKVTLEVVQLSIECVEASNACYRAVGKSLSSQRLLLSQIAAAPGHPTRRRHHRKADQPVRVTITLFDVQAGEATNVADRTFKNASEAAEGVGALIAEAVAPAATSTGSARSAAP